MAFIFEIDVIFILLYLTKLMISNDISLDLSRRGIYKKINVCLFFRDIIKILVYNYHRIGDVNEFIKIKIHSGCYLP